MFFRHYEFSRNWIIHSNVNSLARKSLFTLCVKLSAANEMLHIRWYFQLLQMFHPNCRQIWWENDKSIFSKESNHCIMRQSQFYQAGLNLLSVLWLKSSPEERLHYSSSYLPHLQISIKTVQDTRSFKHQFNPCRNAPIQISVWNLQRSTLKLFINFLLQQETWNSCSGPESNTLFIHMNSSGYF